MPGRSFGGYGDGFVFALSGGGWRATAEDYCLLRKRNIVALTTVAPARLTLVALVAKRKHVALRRGPGSGVSTAKSLTPIGGQAFCWSEV